MADLSTHYKEINPMQTVQNVKDFFESNNLRVVLSDNNQSEAGTWYCHLTLYLGDTILVESNGKGVTEEYSLASAHAELYERFCNGMSFIPNPYFTRTLMAENYSKNGYYFRPDEKILTYDELIHCCDRVEKYFSVMTEDIPKIKEASVEYITNGKYVGVPLKNIDGTDTIYVDPRLLLCIARSVGMAAGNSIEEALVQGLSELAEKQAELYLFTHFDEGYYALDLDKIDNPTLQTIIQKIKSAGYDLYLFDLSYTCNVPAMMSLLIDRTTGTLNVNFGSFPVFDIAAERVLTELYQGINTYHNNYYKGRFQMPYKLYDEEELFNIYGNSITGEVFSASFFKNIKYADTYNHDIFTDKNTTNKELVKYYINLGEKNNVKYYFINNSLSDKIYAIHIFPQGENVFTGMEGHDTHWNSIIANQAITILKRYTQLYDEIYNNNNQISIINAIQLLLDVNNYRDKNLDHFIGYTVLWHNVLLGMSNRFLFNHLAVFIDNSYNIEIVPPYIIDSFDFIPYKKYLQLRLYANSNQYTNEELLYIFNNIFNYNITEEDISNCQSGSYLLLKGYIEPLINYIHSEEYLKFIQIFTNKSLSSL